MRKVLLATTALAFALGSLAYAQNAEQKKEDLNKERTQHSAPAAADKSVKEDKNKKAAEKSEATEKKRSESVEKKDQKSDRGNAASDETKKSTVSHENGNENKRSDKKSTESKPDNKNLKSTESDSDKRKNEPPTKAASETKEKSTEKSKTNQEADKNKSSPAKGSDQENKAAASKPGEKEKNKSTEATTTERTSVDAKASSLPPEKKVKISETISHKRDLAPPVRDIHVSITVGTQIPRRIQVHRVPEEIVSIEPAYRDYDYFTTEDTVVIIEPRTRRIVTTIPRDVSAARAEVGSTISGSTRVSSGDPPPCQVLRRDSSGHVTELRPSEYARETTGSTSQEHGLAVTVRAPNGQTMPPIAIRDRSERLVAVITENGGCEISIETKNP